MYSSSVLAVHIQIFPVQDLNGTQAIIKTRHGANTTMNQIFYIKENLTQWAALGYQECQQAERDTRSGSLNYIKITVLADFK